MAHCASMGLAARPPAGWDRAACGRCQPTVAARGNGVKSHRNRAGDAEKNPGRERRTLGEPPPVLSSSAHLLGSDRARQSPGPIIAKQAFVPAYFFDLTNITNF